MSISLNNTQPCPPVPSIGREVPIYITAVPTASTLRYVFGVVMCGERGSIGWDQTGDCLVLYLKFEAIDQLHHPTLLAGDEVWACFRVRDDYNI